ncbi:inovirus Gp2 family protein [Yersinia sp. 2553 StPb PI]|uniref:inovirus Gp2 family protein n=1 Tax=Yersinia sp. 2553 StPb PI TaxID=3117411 RepID=UPI003FA4367D
MLIFNEIKEMVLDKRQVPFNTHYLQQIMKVIWNALNDHSRTTVIRVDLRLPEYRDIGDSIIYSPDLRKGLMSRFIESLNAKIAAYRKRKARGEKRIHRNSLRYIWVREQADLLGKKHYHAVLFVSTECFNTLGIYDDNGTGLASLIQEAWLSALGMSDYSECRGLARFPEHPLYFLDVNRHDFREALDKLTLRISYLAKERTKIYSSEERSFGCSQA